LAERFLKWSMRRRWARALIIAREQIKKAIDTVSELEKAILAASQGLPEEALRSINRLFQIEEEIDDLRREVFIQLAKGELRSRDREDLMHLVKRLDVMADHVKDSARYIKILLDAPPIPEKIWGECVEISKGLVKCASSLRGSIEKLESDSAEAKVLSLHVDSVEHEVDELYLGVKTLLIKYSRDLDPAALVTLNDLFESMEEVADSCADTADYIRIIIATEEAS
jgi:predicted phosphate transport protein (TIGR00153 family)